MYRALLPFIRLIMPEVTEPAERLRHLLADVFYTEYVRHEENAILFYGYLSVDAETAFPVIRRRFEREGFTPMLRRFQQYEVVVAIPGVIRRRPTNPVVNLLLFIATVGTTIWAGSFLAAPPRTAMEVFDPLRLLQGLPFAIALLAILGVHELGHFFLARYHKVDVTLPYFIPVPFGLGTFGAFIQLRSPVENRKALFDVGLAGPVAGFVVAVPLMVLGLSLSEVVPRPPTTMGASLLVRWLANLVQPHGPGEALRLHPIAIAAYIGLWVTAMNLLPVGQLDGGHIAYSALGSAFRYVAIAMVLLMLLLGFQVWQGWFIWAAFVIFTGIDHPPPLNDLTPLDTKRYIAFGVAILIFVVTFVPRPF